MTAKGLSLEDKMKCSLEDLIAKEKGGKQKSGGDKNGASAPKKDKMDMSLEEIISMEKKKGMVTKNEKNTKKNVTGMKK